MLADNDAALSPVDAPENTAGSHFIRINALMLAVRPSTTSAPI
jgi:hypothetical protein